MKNLLKIFLHLILIIVFVSCDNSVSPEKQSKFAIYLLKNDTLATKDIEEMEIRTLELTNKPIILYEDIIGYNFEIHKVYLKENLSYYLSSDSLKVFSEYFGKPFILVANGQRIYLGSFVTGLSSWTPNTPKIVDYSVNNMEKSFLISGAPYYDISTFIDVRNDERIFQALKDKLVKY